MSPRQIAVTLAVLIFIVGAALYVVTRGGGDGDEAVPTTTSSPTTTRGSDADTTSSAPRSEETIVTTSTVTTTTVPPSVSLNVPVVCAADAANAVVAAEVADDAAALLGSDTTVSTLGLGTVHFGMTVQAAAEASGSAMIACEPRSECFRVSPAAAPPGISFLVHASTIERVDIVDGPITSRSGYGIGTTDQQLVDAFGDNLKREAIDSDTVELIFVPTDAVDSDFRVVFTVEDGVVTNLRAGRLPMVLQNDPCA